MITCPPLVDLAVQFIVRESAGFAWALRSHHDRERTEQVLQWHDEAHRAWLSLLAACRGANWSCVASLDRLYAFHGQLAELLERGGILGEHDVLGVRALLEDHLCRLTSESVEGMCADAGRSVSTCHRAPTPASTRSSADRGAPSE